MLETYLSEFLEAAEAEGWLLDPSQVPGRTITRKEADVAWDQAIAETLHADVSTTEQFLYLVGITVVPDPEPTNAEQIKEALMRVDSEGAAHTHGYDLTCTSR